MSKVPLAAFCEEYDEDAHTILPDTRQVASQRQRTTGSDSGYSSHSLRSGAKSEPTDTTTTPASTPTTTPSTTTPVSENNTPSENTDKSVKKVKVHRKDRSRDLRRRSARDDAKMQSAPPRDSVHVRHFPGSCWECDNGLYHSAGPSTPLESRALDYPYYPGAAAMPDYHPTPPPPPPPPLPPSSHTSPYSLPQPGAPQDVISNHPAARSGRSNSYHANGRPISFHGMMPGGYPSSQLGRYEHGPPLSASAYSHSPSFGPTQYAQQPPYYSLAAEYGAPPEQQQPQPPQQYLHHGRDRSMSRTREYPKGHRSSMYAAPQPMVNYSDPPTPTYDEGEPFEYGLSRDSRPPMSPHSASFDYDEDYYRMPPPPLKHRSPPQIIQKRPEPRKMATTTSIHDRRQSRPFDMGDVDAALPEPPSRAPRYRRSRENLIPERSRSLRTSRRNSYREPSTRPSRVAVEGARRRRPIYYNYDDDDDNGDDVSDDGAGDMEEKQREIEEYQATKAKNSSSNKGIVPLTEAALHKAKTQRAGSDSGSQKSRSNSSRASDVRTPSGSNGGTNPNPSNALTTTNGKTEEENKNIVMTMNGVTMSFSQESVGGKKISLRTGDTGALELNIGGNKPKKYLTSGSEYAGTVARRELEAPRRPRDSRRSERASGRSSRSAYSGRFIA